MTIQRQYVLPNCSLVLEGLSADASNVLSILANAEFKIVGIEQPLAGGSEFFKAVVAAVSAYGQRLLSGLDHPDHMESQTALVAVEPAEGQYHRLTVNPELLNGSPPESQGINLSTVQLFDMVEAIDQFYNDGQTLPDFTLELTPLPRKYVRPEEPLAVRALSPVLGLGALAVAALGLFMMPVPELVEPEGLDLQNPAALESPTEDAGDTPDDTDAIAPEGEAPGSINEAPTAIIDNAQLADLQQQVQQQINDADSVDASLAQPLRYQISVAENGDIVGYNPLDAVSLESVDDTPLPALTYIPVEESTAEPVAQFELIFAPDGTVEVVSEQLSDGATSVTPDVTDPVVPEPEAPEPETPDTEVEPEASSSHRPVDSANGQLAALIETPIQDIERIVELNRELRQTIIENRPADGSGSEVRYRVRLDETGNVIGYDSNDPASDRYAAELKLPDLVQAPATDRPQLDFLVVVNDDNVVEVNPWDGWP